MSKKIEFEDLMIKDLLNERDELINSIENMIHKFQEKFKINADVTISSKAIGTPIQLHKVASYKKVTVKIEL